MPVHAPSSAAAEKPVPDLDPVAAMRWRYRRRPQTPWLHEEVAQRMESRLDWITVKPASWVHWSPLLGGLEAHRRLTQRYPDSVVHLQGDQVDVARRLLHTARPSGLWAWMHRWTGSTGAPLQVPTDVDMVWANMALHLHSHPLALLVKWHALLKVGGFVMFSCIGPDTARELQALYDRHGWGPALHPLTDMHDWGDMLLESGFADPVMDMERITLTYSSAEALLDDCRAWGRNLHSQRHPRLRGKAFRQQLLHAIEHEWPRSADGHLCATVELIYGHAFKPSPRLPLAAESAVSLGDMRKMLRTPRPSQP